MNSILRFTSRSLIQAKCFRSCSIQSIRNVYQPNNRLPLLSKRIVSARSLLSTSSTAHDHTKLWVAEKVVSAALLAVIPAAFILPSKAMDHALALSLVVHIHWGLEAIVTDYVRASLFGPVIPKLSIGALYLVSIAALAGLLYLNYSDVGLTTAVRMISKA